jgi:ribosome-binding factor A
MVLIDQGRLIYGDALVTVTEVKMSPDLTLAKVYLSVYNTDNKQAPILEMEDIQQELRQALAHRVRNHIRRVPDLNFYLDDTLDELEKVDRLLKRLKDDNQMGYSRPEVTAEEE